jgi:hypothetical protein
MQGLKDLVLREKGKGRSQPYSICLLRTAMSLGKESQISGLEFFPWCETSTTIKYQKVSLFVCFQ